MALRIGISTGGGDAPGLNAVIRAFVKHGCRDLDLEVIGIEDAFDGLLCEPRRLMPLDLKSCQGLLHRGGTILGTTNRGDPFAYPTPSGPIDRSRDLAAAAREAGLQGIVCIGGEGTQGIALRLMRETGLPVIGVPKTIDNDLGATDVTFGFASAVDVATEALDRLHTTAESHERVMFLEVMGRDTGHIALHAGIAGGADVILLPELPYDPERVAAKIQQRIDLGRPFTIVVVAEGAVPNDCTSLDLRQRHARIHEGGGAASLAVSRLRAHCAAEMRVTVLGYLQRGGSPIPQDRILATRFGVAAADLVAQGRWGEMVCLRNGQVIGVSIEEAVRSLRTVDLDGELVRVARATGIELGG
ncbi:MAG: ATP-dependent 6-phosphofructokinase [Myxococcota bacterium]